MNNQPDNENLLSHLQGAAIRAHNNISFSPERRGEQMIKDYGEELAEDIAHLTTDGASEENIADYKIRYEKFFRSYLSAKSNTFSVLLTGGSNFPVARHAKANRSEQKHYEVFREWRTRAIKSIIRKTQPVKTFTTELDRYRADLEGMKRNHELMKEGNKRIAKAKKTGEDISQYLKDTFNIPPHMIQHTMTWGFGLQNNNANMKRVEARIKELEQKESLRGQNPVTNYSFEGGKMVIDYDLDRIQIIFDTRPTVQELAVWKSKGLNTFNWSPTNTAWQRKITPNAIRCVKAMLTGITKI